VRGAVRLPEGAGILHRRAAAAPCAFAPANALARGPTGWPRADSARLPRTTCRGTVVHGLHSRAWLPTNGPRPRVALVAAERRMVTAMRRQPDRVIRTVRWISWTNLACGVWLVASAFVLPQASGTGIIEDVVTGSFAAVFALWAARAFRPTMSLVASWTVALTGLWILVAPFALGYERESASVVNDVVVGLAILSLAAVNVYFKSGQLPG